VPHKLGVNFVAVNRRVADMNNSIWPTADHAHGAAAQLFRAKRSIGSSLPAVEGLSRHGLAVVQWMARRAKTVLQAGK